LIESAIFKYFPPTFYEVAIPQFYLWYLIKISIVPIYFFLIHSSNHPWTKFTSEKINSYFLKPSCEEQKEVDLLRVLGRLLHKKRWNVEESDHRMMTGFTRYNKLEEVTSEEGYVRQRIPSGGSLTNLLTSDDGVIVNGKHY